MINKIGKFIDYDHYHSAFRLSGKSGVMDKCSEEILPVFKLQPFKGWISKKLCTVSGKRTGVLKIPFLACEKVDAGFIFEK